MKRNHGAASPIPLDGIELFRPRNHVASASTKESKDWFRVVVNSIDEDEDEGASVSSTSEGNSAEVYIYDEIGGWWGVTSSDFIDTINKLDVETINLHINSPGGSIFDGVAIYNALLQHKAKVVVSVDSLAASAASFIAQAGDEIVMRRASTMMIHDGSMLAWGDATYLREQAEILDKLSNNIATIYAARAGGTMEEWRATMIGEAWYTAQEAVEAGLADRVDGEASESGASNKWDLSVFNFAGRDAAPSPDLVRQNVMLNRVNKEKSMPPTPQADEATESVENTGPVENETTEPVEVETTAPANSAPVARSPFSVMVNGVPSSNADEIQRHINSLEGFYNETRSAARTQFVNELASGGKIVPAQVDSLSELTKIENMTDEQFKIFKDSFENAPVMPLFARHGIQAQQTPDAADKARADRIEVLKETVNRHRMANRSEEEIAKLPSFKELQELQSLESAGQGS